MSNKKQLVLDALNNKPTERVPVGFWFHYTKNEMLPVSENPEMRKRMGEAGRRRIKEVFNWEAKGCFIEQLLEELDKKKL